MLAGHALRSRSVGSTYKLQQRRTAVSASHLAPMDSLHYSLVGSTYFLQQRRTAVLAGHSALRSSSVGSTYKLQQRRTAVLAGYSAPMHYAPARSDPFTSYSSEGRQCSRPLSTHALRFSSVVSTYFLQQRRKAMLAGHSAPMHYAPARSDPLTSYSSEGRQC